MYNIIYVTINMGTEESQNSHVRRLYGAKKRKLNFFLGLVMYNQGWMVLERSFRMLILIGFRQRVRCSRLAISAPEKSRIVWINLL